MPRKPGNRLLDRLAAEYEASLRELRQPGQIAGGLEGMMEQQAALPLESRLMQASMMGVPVASDVAGLLADAVTYGKEPAARTPLNYGLSGLGLLPFIPAMTAYHGSPHKFDKFDSSKIGTGEGAQAYGHGLYFAEDPRVAKSYVPLEIGYRVERDLYAIGNNKAGDALQNSGGDVEKAVATLRKQKQILERPRKGMGPIEAEEHAYNTLKINSAIKQLESGGVVPHKTDASFYHVDIPDEHIARMLDWDAPLSEQPDIVTEVLKNDPAIQRVFSYYQIRPESTTGGDLYRKLSEFQGWTSGDRISAFSGKFAGTQNAAVSQALLDAGIPGIKYYDGGSRAAQQGTRNFVVFDDSIVKILNRE